MKLSTCRKSATNYPFKAPIMTWNKLIALPADVMPLDWRNQAFQYLNITPTYTPTVIPTIIQKYTSTPTLFSTPTSIFTATP